MLKYLTNLIMLLLTSKVYADNTEVLRLNFSEDSHSTSNFTFYFIGLGILLMGVISSEVFKLGFITRFFSRCRVDKLFLKASIANSSSTYDVYVRAMDDVSVDFVSEKKFSKNEVINFKLLTLKGFKDHSGLSELPDEQNFDLQGEVIFSKKVDKQQCATFLTRLKFPILTERVQKPLVKFIEKLNATS